MNNQLSIFENVWLDVVGYEGKYQVNGNGEIKSLNYKRTGEEKVLKLAKGKVGYFTVGFSKNGVCKHFYIHRIVYESFYGGIPKGMEIDHIDGNKMNNRVENLRCVTPKENINNPNTLNDTWRKNVSDGNRKKYRNSDFRKKQAEAVRKATVSALSKPVLQFSKDGKFIKRWNSAKDICNEYGYCNSSISQCCSGIFKTSHGFIWRFEEKEAV